jgi:putative hydrolase of the HAD superfamily
VLFDAVGTLIAPSPEVAAAYHAAGRRFGSQRTIEDIAARFGEAFARQEALDQQASCPHETSEEREQQRWRSIVAEVFTDVADSAGLFGHLWDHFARPAHWRVFDDVADCFCRLRAAGYEVGIASNFDARLELLCAGLPELASCRWKFVSSKLGYKKPSPHFFRGVESALGLAPQQIMLVGDDLENDYLAAGRAGWPAVLLCREGVACAAVTPAIGSLTGLCGGSANAAIRAADNAPLAEGHVAQIEAEHLA